MRESERGRKKGGMEKVEERKRKSGDKKRKNRESPN